MKQPENPNETDRNFKCNKQNTTRELAENPDEIGRETLMKLAENLMKLAENPNETERNPDAHETDKNLSDANTKLQS